jgi:hypothetical protein
LEREAVKTQRPIAAEEEHRVLQFRPRNAAASPAFRGNAVIKPFQHDSLHRDSLHRDSLRHDSAPEPLDLSRYEQPREEPDDFRHRMLANIAAFAFTVALTAVAIWLAMSIEDLRKTQDCVLMGRRDCIHISTP